MKPRTRHRWLMRIILWGVWGGVLVDINLAAPPNPVLEVVYPPGGRAGESFEVSVTGRGLDGLSGLACDVPGVDVRQDAQDVNRFTITTPEDTRPGLYDLRAITRNGLSSPRPLFIGNRAEHLERDSPNQPNPVQPKPVQPNPVQPKQGLAGLAQEVPLNVTVNGRVEAKGDSDLYRFSAQSGQCVIIECWAQRIDSRLRSVLEVYDVHGERLAANRGYFGPDSLIEFHPPQDGDYVVRVSDLVYGGGPEHYYRLDIGTGPRVVFASPPVVQRGTSTPVTLYGWNLNAANPNSHPGGFDQLEVVIPEHAVPEWPLRGRLQPAQIGLDAVPIDVPGGHIPALVGVTDLPVIREDATHDSPDSAQTLSIPCEVCGKLGEAGEQDWYAFTARRGEVLYFEGLGERVGSPMDLDLRVLDAQSRVELAAFSDQPGSIGGAAIPTGHLDPVGSFVVPADGRYLVLARNLTGGSSRDPRCVYRLSIRREERDFRLAIVPRLAEPAGLNIPRGGRTLVEVLAFRSRGENGPIRVTCEDLPSGVTAADVWLGPGVDRGVLVLDAAAGAKPFVGQLSVKGISSNGTTRIARGAVVVRGDQPGGWARLTDAIPLAVAGDAPLRLTANAHETRNHPLYGELTPRYFPGSIVDVAIQVERRDPAHQSDVRLLGVGVPELIANQTATIPAGSDRGYLSFYLPPTLPPGWYSLAVRGETTVLSSKQKPETISISSNTVSIEVRPAAFRIETEPFAPRQIRRGEVIQVGYSAARLNGFIGKIHTELAMPGRITDVVGLRGRGVTFVGQTDRGTIQIIANEDAPLGQPTFLRLLAVGVVEDEPRYFGSCFLPLEVVEED